MKKSVKISKKTGIALFVTAAVIMALLIVFHKNPGPAVDQSQELAKKIISCVVIAAACFAFIHWYDKFTGLPVELFQNRHLIWKLAKNDFKKRYAGSYLGAVWAMAQPVVTVAMYYIVFDKILKLNPLVYIVNGYRSAIYEKEWFFRDFFSTMYFWIVTVVLFGLGAVIFKRLKVHFADVL